MRALLLVAMACAGRSDAPLGHTFAVHDGSHWVAVAWDGRTARVFRDGRAVGSYPASSRIEALWGCQPDDLGPARAGRAWDRPLGPDELASLDLCDVDPAVCGHVADGRSR